MALAFAAGAQGSDEPTKIYKSVDAEGRVTFSDQPPTTGEEAETLHYDTGESVSAEEAEARLQRMRETTDRMAADRREREAARAQAQVPATTPAPPAAAESPRVYYPVYTGRRHRPGWRPPYRPPTRPVHPIEPYRPSQQPYPSSYIRKRYPGAAADIFNPPAAPAHPQPRTRVPLRPR